jgi:hypothetical protein
MQSVTYVKMRLIDPDNSGIWPNGISPIEQVASFVDSESNLKKVST